MVVSFNFLRVASSCPRTLEIYDVSSITVYRVYTQYPYLSQMYHATTYVLDRTAQVTQPLIYHDLNLMHRPLLPAPTQTWQLSVWATNGWCLVPKYGMYCVNIPLSPQTLCLTISGRRTRFNFLFFTLDNMCQSEMPQASGPLPYPLIGSPWIWVGFASYCLEHVYFYQSFTVLAISCPSNLMNVMPSIQSCIIRHTVECPDNQSFFSLHCDREQEN